LSQSEVVKVNLELIWVTD